MKSEEMVATVIDSQIDLLKQSRDALVNGDFITAGITLRAVGTMCSQLGESVKPFAALQFIMDKDGKAKMKAVEDNIDKTHQQLLELFKDDTEGLPKQ